MAARPKAFARTPETDKAVRWAEHAATDPGECRMVRAAAGRFLRDLDAAKRGDGEWVWRPEFAEGAMTLATLLPNIKGPEAGKPLRLMDWQRFIYANVFGFVEVGTLARRYRQASVWVPRGNGKTTLAAPIALDLTFMEGEGGAEGYAAAVTRDQARILFNVAKQMTLRAPVFRRRAGIQCSARAIYQERTASSFAAVSSDAKALDGLNVQVAVCDEIGSHKTSEVYDVLLTAMSKRLQPFLLSISTATGNHAGIGKQVWDYAMRLLDGVQDDDRMFAMIYTPDEDDDLWSEEVWRKVNPGWGQTVQPVSFRATAKQARNNAAQESAFKTRHLNIWVGADDALFSMAAWLDCTDRALTIEQFAGLPCHLGLDLASKTDLAALAIVFPDGDRYTAFCRCYLNNGALVEQRNPSYPGWAQTGQLIITKGNETDFNTIEQDLIALCGMFQVKSVAFDPWAATQLAQRCTELGVPMVEMRQTVANLSEPTKELDAAIRGRRIAHDGNGPLTWCIGNVVGHTDRRGNIMPVKLRREQKIDGAHALIMAIARCMVDHVAPSVYEKRGVLVLG